MLAGSSYGASHPAFGSGAAMSHHAMAYVAMPAGMMALYAPAGGMVYAAPPPARYGPSTTDPASHVAGGGGHGFSFMQGSGAASSSSSDAEDSFSFVKDEMKAKATAGKK